MTANLPDKRRVNPRLTGKRQKGCPSAADRQNRARFTTANCPSRTIDRHQPGPGTCRSERRAQSKKRSACGPASATSPPAGGPGAGNLRGGSMQFETGRPGSLPRGPAAAAAGRGQPVARRGSRFRRMLAAGSTLAVAMLAVAVVAAPAQAAATDKVEKQLLNELATKGSTQFLVYVKDQADLSKADSSTGTAKTEYVYNQLTSTAAKSQAGLTSMLKSANVAFT